MSVTATPDDTSRRRPATSRGDRLFSGIARVAALTILLALAGVFVFLFIEGFSGLSADESVYKPATDFLSYVGPLVFGTIWAAVVALVIAVPFSIGVALFLSHYAPPRLSAPIAYLIDLLAAVPSVVYGLWGGLALAQAMKPALNWLEAHLGWLPFFAGPASVTGRTMLVAGLVLAIMVVPIVTAISREIFAQTPRLHEEAAMALGATRWETIRLAVFPYARSGVISAIMLGLGRALGETMAVAMVLSASPIVTLNLISDTNPATIASNIASNYKEASPDRQAVLIATGLVLFAVTFAVNFAARMVIARGERKIAR